MISNRSLNAPQGALPDFAGIGFSGGGSLSLSAPSTLVKLNRWLSRPGEMFGVMAVYDQGLGWIPYCTTLEDPWLGNESMVSCIPSGRYICRKYSSPKYPSTYEVTGVPGRGKILFHWGNTSADSKGCIILGSSYGIVDSRPAVTVSLAVFKAFMLWMGDRPEFTLDIYDTWGGTTQLVQ